MTRRSAAALLTTAALLVGGLLADSRSGGLVQDCPEEVTISDDQFPLDGVLELLSSNASSFGQACSSQPLVSWRPADTGRQIVLCSFNLSDVSSSTELQLVRPETVNWTLQSNWSACRSSLPEVQEVRKAFETPLGNGSLIFNTRCVCYRHHPELGDSPAQREDNATQPAHQTHLPIGVDNSTVCLDCRNGTTTEPEVDGCRANPCRPNGVCIPKTGGAYRCQCHRQFCGEHCEFALECGVNGTGECVCLNIVPQKVEQVKEESTVATAPCDRHDCRNNATCVSEANSTLYQCQCVAGYTGRLCETQVVVPVATTTVLPTTMAAAPAGTGPAGEENATRRPLCDQPCLNGGRCVGRNRCACLTYYLGANCGFLHTCRMYAPCKNDGQCVIQDEEKLKSNVTLFQSNASYSCVCKPAWTGRHCEQPANPCKNNGVLDPSSDRCNCDGTGHTGDLCQLDASALDVCSLNKSICGPHGVCATTGPGMFRCDCAAGYHGELCELTDASDGESPLLIVGAVFGAFGALGLVVGALLLVRYLRRSRELKGKYNPAKEEMKCATTSALPLSNLKTGERLI